jgi:beta-xylosidase
MTFPWNDAALTPRERAQLLLNAMTIDEKLAQLGSYWPRPEPDADEGSGDVAPLEHAFQEAHLPFGVATANGLGQLTRPFGSAPITPAEGVASIRQMQSVVTGGTRLGVPAIVHEECLTGFTTLGATVYPTPLAWGATFDPSLIERMAASIGADMFAVGVHQGLSPVLDVVRDYRWGRVEEAISEDPYLVAMIATAYVTGLQSSGVIATLKHFAGYSASRAARNHAPVSIGNRELRDVILPPFETAIRVGGARSVMNSYSDVDGVPAAASHELLTRILRDEWGFEGTVVSDYWAIAFLDMMHLVSADREESGRLALAAGIDVELPESDAYSRLGEWALKSADNQAVVDQAVLRVLTQKAEAGLLNNDWTAIPDETGDGSTVDLDSAENRSLAREIAEKSIVLLHNDGALPLSPSISRIAVVGPTADEARSLLGCYSFPNHVLSRLHDAGTGVDVPSLLAAIKGRFDAEIEHRTGVPILDPDASGIEAAVQAARRAELAIVCVGDLSSLFGRGTSGEGCDAEDLSLPGLQGELLETVLQSGTPVVLVVISGRPYALGDFEDRCAAVIQAFLPGEEGAEAVARVLDGTINPSGRLPVSIPTSPGGQPGTYLAPVLGRYSEGISNLDPTPLHPFGYGLSYTSFAYESVLLSATNIDATGSLQATVRVRNTGTRDGDEVVQVYLADDVSQVVRPLRTLVAFHRVALAPGETADVTFDIDAARTAFTGKAGHRIVEAGWFTLHVGRSSEDLPLSGRFCITGQQETEVAPVLVTPSVALIGQQPSS